MRAVELCFLGAGTNERERVYPGISVPTREEAVLHGARGLAGMGLGVRRLFTYLICCHIRGSFCFPSASGGRSERRVRFSV